MIIYDCEIVKAIQGKNEDRLAGIEYCEGWRDFRGMGISVICVYDYEACRYRVFAEDNFDDFQTLVNNADIVVGFNSLGFDNRLCLANGLTVPDEKSYDLLAELWVGAGLSKTFQFPSHIGFSLEACSQVNLGLSKTGNGALAPVDWQRGNVGKVIDYCLSDIFLTKSLLDLVVVQGYLVDPRDTGKTIHVRRPNEPTATKEFTKGEIAEIFSLSKKCKVVFVKKDGSIRTMICTNDFLTIPEEFRPADPEDKERPGKPTPDHLFPVFDLGVNDWRSFTVAKVLSIDPA